jgi:asparagine synthase (glutamine-hydrolysing)
MCGIAGAVSQTGDDLRFQVLAMMEAQKHRGPDDAGVWEGGTCALGHRRLSIIDLSSSGRQPLSNDDQTLWITFNGEIYNFQSLRKELESLGHRFRTRTDTEVIIRAYERWGIDAIKRLRGMFAFAMWDQRKKRLLLARDRVGKKPLFYAYANGCFLFASELQGLLASPHVPREINISAIDSYLTWGYVPAPDTGFQGVFKLPPAHWMSVSLADGEIVTHTERYWSLEYEPKLSMTEDEAAEALREKLTESVRLRMISDVPLGAFLSGGIDSSIVVGLMAGHSSKPVKTFSIGFKESAYNETDHARRVANRWGTDHHEFIVEPDALAILPKLVRHYGEPFADSSAIPTFYVSEMTRASVTVALNGDGGDESFGGYERYLGNRLAQRIQSVPGLTWSSRLLSRVLPDSFDPKNPLRQVRRFLTVAAEPMAKRYGSWMRYFSQEAKIGLYRKETLDQLNYHQAERWMEESFAESESLDPADAAMSVDVRSYLPYDLLVKVDITSMANSLEARSPFLDHDVMEFAARLPATYKLKGRRAKYLLKKAFADLLPPENNTRRKMGFAVPVGKWFRGPLRSTLEDALVADGSALRDYFEPASIKQMVTEHLDRRVDHSFRLWSLLMLEMWFGEVVKAPSAPLDVYYGREADAMSNA